MITSHQYGGTRSPFFVSLVSVHLYFYLCIRNVPCFHKAPAVAESIISTEGFFDNLKWGKDIISNAWLSCSHP